QQRRRRSCTATPRGTPARWRQDACSPRRRTRSRGRARARTGFPPRKSPPTRRETEPGYVGAARVSPAVRDALLRHERSRDVDASVAVLRLIADRVGRLANALHHLRNVQTAALRDEQGGKPRDVRRRRARSVGPEIEVLVTGAYRCVAAARAEDHLGKQ